MGGGDDQTPTDGTLVHVMLVMILRGQRIGVDRTDFVAAALATIYACMRRLSLGPKSLIEKLVVVLLEKIPIFIPCHNAALPPSPDMRGQ
jgi:hypothetical protein